MQNYEGTLGAMSIWRRWLEEESLKLPGVAAWLCCVLLVGVSLTQTASAQTVTYIHTDALGSVVAETDANGSVIKRYDYEPYGAVVGGEVTDGPGYTGHVSDSVTGLSYMQQRYMDPQLGVFLSVDPVTAYQKPVEQFNRYRYANGNPYKFTDPDGRNATLLAPIVVIPIVAGTFYYATTTPQQRKQAGDAVVDGVIDAASKVRGYFQKSESGDSRGTTERPAPSGECSNCGGETTDKVGTIASDTGRSAQDVKDAIHSAKENLPKSSGQRNPDVEVCRSCGEVYPKVSGGNIGDSIGNIHD